MTRLLALPAVSAADLAPDSDEAPRTASSHLRSLEAESIHILREVAAEFRKPVMLYSIGKDSSVLLHLAMKAFYPAKPPFPLLHIDTTWKFREMIAFRDQRAREMGLELLVHSNAEGIAQGISPFSHGSGVYTREGGGPPPGPSPLPPAPRPSPRGGGRRGRPAGRWLPPAPPPRGAPPAATRRSRAPRSASSRTGAPRIAGIRRTSAPSCGV